MRRISFAILAAAALLGTGCDEKASQFALKTKDILDQQTKQITRKIAAEKAAYAQSAALAAEDHRNLVNASLLNERNERSDELAADYDEGRKPVSLWRKDVSDYARIDYEQNRGLLSAEMDASTRYMERFENLKLEQDRVDALSKLLTALAKKPSLKDDFDALSGFAEDTKDDFDKKVCAQLKSQTSGADAKAKAAKKSYDDKQCDDVLKAPK